MHSSEKWDFDLIKYIDTLITQIILHLLIFIMLLVYKSFLSLSISEREKYEIVLSQFFSDKNHLNIICN